ncbi:MAG TPA: 1,4-alpha-glucan branching protein domain-containing protein [Chthoniobacterales bacterium]|nr:1,4-alpha-glucan branching protein domain-containing protein [Chthoniobacterales bacterium]
MSKGHLALILHAHLPFIRHPEHEHFLEEEWFFEAATESYIPLLQMQQRLVNDAVPFKLTISLTPTLTAMLQDELLRERYVQHVDLLIDLAAREQKRNRKDARLRELAHFYSRFLSATRRFFVDECKCDLLAAFRKLRRAGVLEIIASAATHGLLPLLAQQSPAAARAQVLIGRDQYVGLWSEEPKGFWLPECAYAPELDRILQETNIRWFVLDAHGLLFGNPQPCRAIFAPCYTRRGPAAFARDRDSSRQIWSAHEGYPGDPAYREFYRDAGFDLPLEHLGPVAAGRRKFSGLKYHRITGRGPEKELYDRAAAEHRAQTHAAHFLEQRREQLRRLNQQSADPIVVIPFDAELFGHWWFEGPLFLEWFIRKTASEQDDFCLTTPSEYLAAHPTQQTIEPARSTWGENGDLSVWINPANAWIYPHLHGAARRMTEVARAHANEPSSLGDRVLKQLTRELLLAQSSDWAFLMKTGTAREYATKRTIDHLGRFNRLHDQFAAKRSDEVFLRDCEERDNLFPDVNWRYYA